MRTIAGRGRPRRERYGVHTRRRIAGEVEVLHWWTSGGEAKSVAELKKMLESQGRHLEGLRGGRRRRRERDDRAQVARGVRASRRPPRRSRARASRNGPPRACWPTWTTSPRPATGIRLLPPVVSDVMKYQGHYVAVPVNVHRVNWMWANPEVFKKAGAKIPTNWDEFAVAADKIQKAGLIAVAHGGQPWQDATLFESIALGVGGAEWYRKAFVDLDPKALNSPAMEKSFATLRMVQKYIDKDAANRDWNLATAMVINGKAGMQFMGDWAKGEFTAAGKVAGQGLRLRARTGHQGRVHLQHRQLHHVQAEGRERAKGAGSTSPSAIMDVAVPGGVQPEQGLDPGAPGHGPGQVRPMRQGLGCGVRRLDQERHAGTELGARHGHAAGQQRRDVRRRHQLS